MVAWCVKISRNTEHRETLYRSFSLQFANRLDVTIILARVFLSGFERKPKKIANFLIVDSEHPLKVLYLEVNRGEILWD